MKKKLERDESKKMLGGVMAGFSNYFKHDVTIWRIGIVGLALVTAVIPVVAFYLISWLVMPVKDRVEYTVIDD